MREAYDRTRSTETAVVEGIGRTGRLVTSAALILGRWNWWLADWAARVLRVGPSRAQPDATPVGVPQTA